MLTIIVDRMNAVPCLTAAALLELKEAYKGQLAGWLKEMQQHERLAVGHVASRSHTEVKRSGDGNHHGSKLSVDVGAVGSTMHENKSQDEGWSKELQGREQLTVDETASYSCTDMEVCLDGKGDESSQSVSSGAMGSTVVDAKTHGSEDTFVRVQTHEPLALRECGSRFVGQENVTFEDFDVIFHSKDE